MLKNLRALALVFALGLSVQGQTAVSRPPSQAQLLALVQFGKPEAVPALVELVADPDTELAQAAHAALAAFPGQEADAAVLTMLDNSNTACRLAAIQMAGQRRLKTAAPGLLKPARDADANIRLAAIKAIGDVGARQSLPDLLEPLRKVSQAAATPELARHAQTLQQRAQAAAGAQRKPVHLAAAADPATPSGTSSSGSVNFLPHRLGTFRSEALGVADLNGDGKLDIVAGAHLYLAPDWKALKIRTLPGQVDEQGKGYHDDFMNLPLDVDGDGKPDVVSCGWFSKSVRWYRNRLGQDGDWPETIVETSVNFEAGELVDVDGDGQAREILPDAQPTWWFEAASTANGSRGLVKHVISEKKMNYGGGVGDVNGDGRPDVLRPDAWFEAPADPRRGTWIEHPWALGAKDGKVDHTPQILVCDVNGDNLPDVITSSAHKHGIWWYEPSRTNGQTTWKQHLIDDTWSQAHSLALGDLNGDGAPDLITGKRFMAHNGNDPDEFGKLGVYWYELKRGPAPAWTKHAISYDEGIGSGVNLVVTDLDGDRDLDVVVTGKWGGPVWFENQSGRNPR